MAETVASPDLRDLARDLRAGRLTPDGLGPAYESRLAAAQVRRVRGAFYTPVHVAEAIVAETLAPWLSRPLTGLLRLRVLDPAAGAGIFLLAAGRAIAAAATRAAPHLPPERLRRAVARWCLNGIDQDPVAVQLCRLALTAEFGHPGRIVRADSLAAEAPVDRRFDAVIGNPPFLSVKRGHLAADAARLRRRFALAVGQWDSYMLFVERGLALLRDGGRLGYVLPRPALTNAQAEPLRRHLFATGGIESVIDLGAPFADAGVETVGVIACRGTLPPTVRLATLRADGVRLDAELPVDWVRQRPGLRLSPSLRPAAVRVGSRRKLRDVATLKRGLELGKRHPAVVAAAGPGTVPLLRGEDVGAGRCEVARHLRLEALRPAERKDPALFEPRPKLVIRRVASRPIAAVDEVGCWCLNTLYVLLPREPLDLAALAEWLNGDGLAAWFAAEFGSDERLFPYLRQSQLLELPLP